MKTIRTRFAPSPTGALHAGAVRTALFGWLLARQSGGDFILRIEDTDQVREVEGAVQNIIDSLKFVGIDWTEGPDKGGPFGPYTQSQRLSIYKEWADKLVSQGKAYADPYSAEQVDQFRDNAKAAKKPFLFRDYRPENPPVWDGSQPLRLKSDPKNYQWHDAVMGDLQAGPESIDDFILIKSDGFPTYNFAHIIDDHLMGINHVIRSQEFIPSTPKYLNLYEALGIDRPVFATVPPVLSPDGKHKLSKRLGAKQILDYKTEGYLPSALINFIATLGWNDGSEQEIYTVQEIIEKFSLDRIQKSGAVFDERRLLWVNGSHIRALPIEELAENVKDFWPASADNYPEDYKLKVLKLVQERLKFFAELADLSELFFTDLPVNPSLIADHKQLKKLPTAEIISLLEKSQASLSASDFSTEDLSERLNALLEETDQKPAVLFSLIRIVITEAPSSPGLADTLNVLGKDRSLSRLANHLRSLA